MDISNIRYLFRNCKKNAKQRGINFEINLDDLIELYETSEGKCCMTGIKFDTEPPNGKKRPFAASVDRIDSNIGYIKDNCRIVCVAINLAMNWYGEEVFDRIAQNYISNNADKEVKHGEFSSPKALGKTKLKDGTYSYYPRIGFDGRTIWLGSYRTEGDAIKAYEAAKSERAKQKKFNKDKADKISKLIEPVNKKPSERRIKAVAERQKRYKNRCKSDQSYFCEK